MTQVSLNFALRAVTRKLHFGISFMVALNVSLIFSNLLLHLD